MPEIARFYGIVIKMFFTPKEHEPSHIHALYGEYMGDFNIQRILKLVPLPDFQLAAAFDDGRKVVYDVKEDLWLPGYHLLAEVPGLFQQVQLDESRTCVFWSDEIDLPSHAIYEYGRPVEELPEPD